jgi:hypothetical protein
MENYPTNTHPDELKPLNDEIFTKNNKENDKQKYLFLSSKVKKINNWTNEEDKILLKYAEKFKFKNWKQIAEYLEGRSAIQCSARYKRIRPGIIKGAWTDEEDQLLLQLLKKFGKNWSLISKYMTSRSGKQIRDRYLNSLDPNIVKIKFTPEEDKKILELYTKYGSAWSKIAKEFTQRTGDMIKNRFYSSLRKQVHHDDYRETLRQRQQYRVLEEKQKKGENYSSSDDQKVDAKTKILNKKCKLIKKY